MNRYMHLLLLLLIAAITGCDRNDTPTDFTEITVSTPNHFLKYPNTYPSLPAGDYTLVAATAIAGISTNYILSITFDDGTTQTLTGNWNNSGGQDALSPNNPRHTFTLNRAGGLTAQLQSDTDDYLYLLDRNNAIVSEDDNSAGGTHARISLPTSRIDNEAWSTAYYAAIDPLNERDTLSKWKHKNGFDAGYDYHVIFRDTKDLGYGRSIYARRNANGCIALYVENFSVNLIDGLSYNLLNLAAAINDDQEHHFGTNAIEFSDLDGNCDGSDPMFAKFYTFKAYPEAPEADETRLLKVDLDKRGAKHMPGPCIICHGGTARPLLADGSFPSAALPHDTNPGLRVGDTLSRMQPLEVDSFEYSDKSGYSRAEQEASLKAINLMVYETFPVTAPLAAPPVDESAAGEWTGDFIREVVDGWYGNDINNSANTTFDNSFVPAGWQHDSNDNIPPATAPELFLSVVKPYCFACHSKRGSDLGSNLNANLKGKDIDFSTYEKFISHIAQIEDYVYVRGLMPISKLTYEKFWDSNAPEILASHIPGFSHGNADGSINEPGAPAANPGLDRTTNTPVTLSAASSVFANAYNWSITSSPAGSQPTLSDSTSIRPVFNTDLDGIYQIQLIASNGSENSAPVTLTLTVNNSLVPAIADITFDTHIKPILQNTDPVQAGCLTCHNTDGAGSSLIPGIPVWYSDSASLYKNVLLRVNFDKPELSPLLLKPSGNHHYGGVRAGFDLVPGDSNGSTNDNRDTYNLFLNWILQGAREN
jgi:mono/diheme cytochrome c family protein